MPDNVINDLLTRQEVTLKQLRTSIDGATDQSQFPSHLKILKLITKDCLSLKTKITDTHQLVRIALIQAECHAQFVRLTFATTRTETTNIDRPDSIFSKHKHFIEKALITAKRSSDKSTLDYILQQWADNLWAVGMSYYNELSKHLLNPAKFDEIFNKTKNYFAESRKYYEAINNLEMRNAATQYRTGNILRTVDLYSELGDKFSKLETSNRLANLQKAITMHRSAEAVLGHGIKNKSHTGVLIKICDTYREQLEILITENQPKDQLLAVNSKILGYAQKIDLDNKIGQPVTWDHKLRARAHIVLSLKYLFDQEKNDTSTNQYGAALVEASQALVDFYFAHAVGLIEKGYCETLDKAHKAAKMVLQSYRDVRFVDENPTTQATSPTEAFQQLSIDENRPKYELEVKEMNERAPLDSNLVPMAKRFKTTVPSADQDKENLRPNSNQNRAVFYNSAVGTKEKEKVSAVKLGCSTIA